MPHGELYGTGEVILIASVSINSIIATPWGVPWPILQDNLSFVKEVKGYPVILGRKTFEKNDKMLLGSKTIVMTTMKDYRANGVQLAYSLPEALYLTKDHDRRFIAGGARIFKQALSFASVVMLTEVDLVLTGHLSFPRLSYRDWHQVAQYRQSAKCSRNFNQNFSIYHRKFEGVHGN